VCRLRAGILGWPVFGSLSPALHSFWLQKYGIDGSYDRFPVMPSDCFNTSVRRLCEHGYRGANVTAPYKEAAYAMCDTLTPEAKRAGSVNTLVFSHKHGTVHGDTTDGRGFWDSMQAADYTPARQAPVLVIGAGGAARAVITALHAAGYAFIRVVNRTPSRAQRLRDDLGISFEIINWADRAVGCADIHLLINTASYEESHMEYADFSINNLPQPAVVCDIVYRPLMTPLLRSASARRHITLDGLGMLMHQARYSFQQWFGVLPNVDNDVRSHLLGAMQVT
jgi:shikimate dehydrogenase